MESTNTKTLLITKKEILDLFTNRELCIQIVENAFKEYNNNQILLPSKISQIFDKEKQNRINCMPATLLNSKICGVKWISVFPENPKYGINNVSGIIILSEIEHGLPIAIMDGTIITSLRTAAVGAVAAKYLSKIDSKSIGFIGAGNEAKAHLDMIYQVRPQINTCYVSSRTNKTVEKFINEKQKQYPNIKFINCQNDYQKAVENSDIIITATSTQKDILKASWIKKGATYIHVGGWEDEYEVAKKANKIICDDWESVKHRGQTICKMYKEGMLHDEDIYANLKDIIVTKNKPGRENNEEFIYFNSVGLSFIDIHFAKYVYEKIKPNKNIPTFEF